MTFWLSRELILAIHDEQIAEHGGASGIRDEGLLESALSRRLNRASYGDPDVAELAAVYATGIVLNHPFVDGNKRAGFAALFTFLGLNGATFEPPEVDATMAMLRLAAGELNEDEFIDWVRANTGVPNE
jgi:death-on-curing protein